jgi:hypothetical protein
MVPPRAEPGSLAQRSPAAPQALFSSKFDAAPNACAAFLPLPWRRKVQPISQNVSGSFLSSLFARNSAANASGPSPSA